MEIEDIQEAEFEEIVDDVPMAGNELKRVTTESDNNIPIPLKRAKKPSRKKIQKMFNSQKPFVINHANGKPDENMIQIIMNMKSLSQEFKMACLDRIVKQDFKWIEKRLMKESGDDERDVALHAHNKLRDQIKRDKKYLKSLTK